MRTDQYNKEKNTLDLRHKNNYNLASKTGFNRRIQTPYTWEIMTTGGSTSQVLSVPKETGCLNFVPMPYVKNVNVIGSAILKTSNETYQIIQRVGSLMIVKF